MNGDALLLFFLFSSFASTDQIVFTLGHMVNNLNLNAKSFCSSTENCNISRKKGKDANFVFTVFGSNLSESHR